jgi:predicted methyltransferase
MIRTLPLFLVSSMLWTACDGGGSPSPAKDGASAAAGAERPASSESKPKGDAAGSEVATGADAKPDDADAKPDAEDEAKKKQEQRERFAKAMAELEDWKKRESTRWTDEIDAKVGALIEGDADTDAALAAILASPHRHPDNPARDEARHPAETLRFFGIQPSMTVVEVGPGWGWYTEILAPLLARSGKLVVTQYDPAGSEEDSRTMYGRRLQAVLGRSKVAYGKVEPIVQKDPDGLDLGPPGSADMVLIIRGLHGRVTNEGQWDRYMKAAHSVLKDGGVLGIVQHRGKDEDDPKKTAEVGYLPEPWVVAEIEKAGFELEEKSEINANPKDTKDHERGVWSLPPTLTHGDEDRDKYLAIGESDRMTLRFKKK